MGKSGDTFWDSLVNRRALQRWTLAAGQARTEKLAVLRKQRSRARALRIHLDRLIHTADERLALPAVGATNFPKPHNADWTWRPELWRGALPTPGLSSVQNSSVLGEEVTVFHDCGRSEITLRQIRNLRPEDLAPYGLQVDIFHCEGSFLSTVVDLPEASIQGLKRSHILRVGGIIEMETPLEVFVRLNVRHGPNTEQVVRQHAVGTKKIEVEFDLSYANLNEKRVEKIWVDIIFERPVMNLITLRDLTFSRCLRAQI